MAVAPVVNYYRLVYDETATGSDQFKFAEATDTPATLLDFGIVDAGDDNWNPDKTKYTADYKPVQVYAIYNNRGAGTGADVSDMQNTKLSVVSNESGKEGNTEGTVYYSRWIQILLNGEDHDSDGWTSLGKYDPTTATAAGYKANQCLPNFNELGNNSNSATDAIPTEGTADSAETKKELTAFGFSGVTGKAGIISGASNGGTLTGTDQENFARITVWPITAPNAPAGAHKFRLRTTYSYT